MQVPRRPLRRTHRSSRRRYRAASQRRRGTLYHRAYTDRNPRGGAAPCAFQVLLFQLPPRSDCSPTHTYSSLEHRPFRQPYKGIVTRRLHYSCTFPLGLVDGPPSCDVSPFSQSVPVGRDGRQASPRRYGTGACRTSRSRTRNRLAYAHYSDSTPRSSCHQRDPAPDRRPRRYRRYHHCHCHRYRYCCCCCCCYCCCYWHCCCCRCWYFYCCCCCCCCRRCRCRGHLRVLIENGLRRRTGGRPNRRRPGYKSTLPPETRPPPF